MSDNAAQLNEKLVELEKFWNEHKPEDRCNGDGTDTLARVSMWDSERSGCGIGVREWTTTCGHDGSERQRIGDPKWPFPETGPVLIFREPVTE